jgi:hypothetical protein
VKLSQPCGSHLVSGVGLDRVRSHCLVCQRARQRIAQAEADITVTDKRAPSDPGTRVDSDGSAIPQSRVVELTDSLGSSTQRQRAERDSLFSAIEQTGNFRPANGSLIQGQSLLAAGCFLHGAGVDDEQ